MGDELRSHCYHCGDLIYSHESHIHDHALGWSLHVRCKEEAERKGICKICGEHATIIILGTCRPCIWSAVEKEVEVMKDHLIPAEERA
tara:strand:- start:993 stop:1256 length:264 start_codon:yes stop_codon:yes gene_type:complete